MAGIVSLEMSNTGGPVYLNPRHVVSVVNVDRPNPSHSIVMMVNGDRWDVRGDARSVAAHLLADDRPDMNCRVATITSLDEAATKLRVPSAG